MGVYYLDFRPQTIEELDNSGGRQVLEGLFKKKASGEEIPKSYLFCGPKGAGKTSAARIFAKAVNCLKREDGACGKCENCQEIAKGKSMDVVEIDAASNRGIDEVRVLKDRVILAPTKLKNKVIIIDEAQMMTKEAFNALLKLLEEPPANTYFIMCTTDPQKIPETVVSRLMRVEFNRGKTEDLKGSLGRVIEREELEVGVKVIEGLIKRSEGSFRNLHRLLNELVVAKGKKIKDVDWQEFEATTFGGYTAEELLEDMVKEKTKTVLDKIEKMALGGVDFGAYLEELIKLSQTRMIESEDRRKWARWLEGLIEASGQMKYCPVAQVPLQVAVVKFMEKEGPTDGGVSEAEAKGRPVPKAIAVKKATQVEAKRETNKAKTNLDLATVETKWAQVLSKVKPFNHSIEAFLRATRPKSIEGDQLVVEVFYPFHKERLEEARNRRVIEEVLKLVLGCDLRLVCLLGKPSAKTKTVLSTQTPSETQAPTEEGGKDLYQRAKEIFG